MSTAFEEQYFSGVRLYGDDFDEASIQLWYADEENGYYDLVKTYDTYVYDYHALNELHAYRFLKGRYPCCVAMGCASGDDVSPLGDRVDQFVAIEPAEKWWRAEIGGRPACYLKPALLGDIPIDTGSVDLLVCFGVLHHIPNVSHVLSEMARILRPGGKLVLREPISTMGDWRAPRRGVTKNERGFPPGWLEDRANVFGLRVQKRNYCQFPLTLRVAKKLGVSAAFNNTTFARLDAILSAATQWNLHYHRDSLFKKIAPDAVMLLCEKIGVR